MKLIKTITFGLIFIVLGYFLGNFFPLSSLTTHDIKGTTQLKVELVMDNGTPVPNLEVDLAEEPGPPPKGGISITKEDGTANFSVKPGLYFIYFNEVSFPKNLEKPELERVQVEEGVVNERTIMLRTRK